MSAYDALNEFLASAKFVSAHPTYHLSLSIRCLLTFFLQFGPITVGTNSRASINIDKKLSNLRKHKKLGQKLVRRCRLKVPKVIPLTPLCFGQPSKTQRDPKSSLLLEEIASMKALRSRIMLLCKFHVNKGKPIAMRACWPDAWLRHVAT